MNRTQQKAKKKAQAQQLAAVMEMRALVHEVARELYVRDALLVMPGGDMTLLAHDCIRAGIAFVDGLNSFVPAPVGPPPLSPEEAAKEEQIEREGEGRELARDAMLEPGSTEEMEALS